VLFCCSEIVIFIFPDPPQREQLFLNSLNAEARPVPLHLRQIEMIFMESLRSNAIMQGIHPGMNCYKFVLFFAETGRIAQTGAFVLHKIESDSLKIFIWQP
jgi:hypothetical protein